jgi:hypothetical protein
MCVCCVFDVYLMCFHACLMSLIGLMRLRKLMSLRAVDACLMRVRCVFDDI